MEGASRSLSSGGRPATASDRPQFWIGKFKGQGFKNRGPRNVKHGGQVLGWFRFCFVLVTRRALNVLILALETVFSQGHKQKQKSPDGF